MYVPMEMDHVSGSEPEEEDWEDVDEVRRRSICDNCVIMGHFARVERKARVNAKQHLSISTRPFLSSLNTMERGLTQHNGWFT